jgi:hypothetical protein
MLHASTTRQRLLFTAIVFVAALAHLAWEHFNGGIRSHHFLANEQFPAMHNAWGALLLPALAWLLSAGIAKRARAATGELRWLGLPRSIVIGFVISLLYGIALLASFAMGFTGATSLLFFAIFALALLLPLYRGECVLGFVFGMTFTFGPFIPALFAGIFALLSAMLHLAIYPFALRLVRSARART